MLATRHKAELETRWGWPRRETRAAGKKEGTMEPQLDGLQKKGLRSRVREERTRKLQNKSN